MSGFVFFDTETTGLRPGWDQIVHFAAIHTDADLREIDRLEVRCRLQPHVTPHPMALLTNGLPIATLISSDHPSHYEMVCRIVRQLAIWSPAIFVGYNSIGFDEEMLRHALFQSLHDPYLTSRPGNGRADVLTLVLAAHALPPHCIIAPAGDDGRPTFKLARVAAANGLAHAQAHDALADVTITLELCRLIRDRADELWQRFLRFSTKAGVSQFVDAEDGFVLSEFFGGGQAVHRPVVCIGHPPGNANGRFCLDLTIDPEHWAGLDDEAMRAELCRKGTPLRRLAVNAAPSLMELWAAPEPLLGGLDLQTAEVRARQLKDNPELCGRIIGIYTAGWTEADPSPHPEERLYTDGFPCDADRARMNAFHDASRAERLEIVSAFEDARLATFGRRLFHAQHRGSLPVAERRGADLDLAEGLLVACGGPLTLPEALAEVDALQAQGISDPDGLLVSYRIWLSERISRTQAFRHGFWPTTAG